MAVLLGQTGVGVDSANSNSAGIACATRLVCLISGTVDSVWLKFGASPPTGANTHWAIYADSAGPVPGARLTTDFSGTAGTASTYSGPFTISPGLVVTAGTFYWIAFEGVGAVLNYTDFATTGGNSSDDNVAGALPATWTQTGGPFTNTINMRAEGTPSGGGLIQTFNPIPFMGGH